jgi:putative phosphoribosyl transferase
LLFRDRDEAGKRLAAALLQYKGKDVVVLGLPRGGVVVARRVAEALGAPLDIVVTRKIGAPGEPEFALGAVTQEGDVILDRSSAESVGASAVYLEEEARRQQQEVKERMSRLRGATPYPNLEGKVVLIVDDGIATGNSIEAAVKSVRKRNPKEVVVAVPVAPADALGRLAAGGTRVVCLETPGMFFAIGEFYQEFAQVEDSEVRQILKESSARESGDSRP